jgi:hypothetical protein
MKPAPDNTVPMRLYMRERRRKQNALTEAHLYKKLFHEVVEQRDFAAEKVMWLQKKLDSQAR